MAWILILTFVTSSGASVESVKQLYPTEQSCKDAGNSWNKQIDSTFRDANYACIPNL